MTQATLDACPRSFPAAGELTERIALLPDGAISIGIEGSQWVLHASRRLQTRFEQLLEGRKTGTLNPAETRECEAICELDTALSWLNRLAREAQPR